MAETLSTKGIYLQALLPLGIKCRCAVCDAPFEILPGRGRPQRFCGDACRRLQIKKQKAAWGERAKLTGAQQ
jgi:hypothetical protein